MRGARTAERFVLMNARRAGQEDQLLRPERHRDGFSDGIGVHVVYGAIVIAGVAVILIERPVPALAAAGSDPPVEPFEVARVDEPHLAVGRERVRGALLPRPRLARDPAEARIVLVAEARQPATPVRSSQSRQSRSAG